MGVVAINVLKEVCKEYSDEIEMQEATMNSENMNNFSLSFLLFVEILRVTLINEVISVNFC